jgi:hypothetical protein
VPVRGAGTGGGAFAFRPLVRESLVTVAASWAAARVLVLGALALTDFVLDELVVARGGARLTGTTGLLGYDAGWYRNIADHGYGGVPDEGLRFFPLVPLLTRAISWTGIGSDAALLLVANLSALALGVLVYVLVVSERGDRDLARRSVWFVALFPAAFVLVWGYAEATTLAATVGGFLALRRRKWWWAAALGFLVGLGRPPGFLLALPALIEVAPGFARAPAVERARRAAAVVAAPLGAVTYLAWVGWRFDEWTKPFSVQLTSDRSGALVNPLSTLFDATRGLLDGNEVGTGLHVPWVLLLVVLAVMTFRYWPLSYAVFGAVVLATGLATDNLDSFERYGLAAFPLLLTAAVLASRPWVERAVLVGLAGGLTGYTILALLALYVP